MKSDKNIIADDRLIEDFDAPEEAEVAEEPAQSETKWNDVIVIGEPSPEFLDANASFLLGAMYGATDKRNTQDTAWHHVTMPWRRWLDGAAKTRNQPAWGLLRHPVAKVKEGPCIVLGSSVEGARKAKAMTDMYALGLDIDSGVTLDSVVRKIQDLGLTAIVYTTFSHGKDGLALKRDDVLKKLKISRDPELNEVQDYLANHSKNRYDPDFITKVEILEQKRQRSTGVEIVLSSPPIEKFRVIFPLKEAVNLVGLAETQQAALDAWEDAVTGVAVNMLGVTFDTSCTDPSRLFFTPRHPKDGEFKTYLICGELLNFDAIEPFSKAQYTRHRDLNNPFAQVGGYEDTHDVFFAFTPSGKSLNEWHKKASTRFQIANLLEGHCSDKIRIAGGEKPGTVHLECPFEHEHSNPGEGTATMAVNALDGEHGRWTVFCRHDACQGKRPLQFLEEMLRSNWFDEDLLTDELYILPGEDEEEDEEEPEAGQEEFELTFDSQEDIEKYFKRKVKVGADALAKAETISAVAACTGISKPELKRIWTKVAKQSSYVELEDSAALLVEWDFMRVCEYVQERIDTRNAKTPTIFAGAEGLVTIRGGQILSLERDAFARIVNDWVRFTRPQGDGAGQRGVSMPRDVRDHLYAGDPEHYPPLHSIATAPFYARSGTLVGVPGYCHSSGVYMAPSGLSVDVVSDAPTAAEVAEAKRLLVEEVLADFPLDGLTRPEIIASLTGTAIPAVTHAVALILQPFLRELIDGPTPGYVFTKPAPGTGATLLVETITRIFGGEPAPTLRMPHRKEEIEKTLATVLRDGTAHVFFDNINAALDSGDLASAMTGTHYKARILGKTESIQTPVRCAWIFTANNFQASGELQRRMIFIPLDAHSAAPEKRTGWRHADLAGWVKQNRGKLVWACLTLIQNWLAKGRPAGTATLGSFEDWAKVVGGIVGAAGFSGFLEGQTVIKGAATADADAALAELLELFSNFEDGTAFRAGSSAPFNGAPAISVKDLLNGEVRADPDTGKERGGPKTDALQVDGWGYVRGDGYTNSTRIGHRLRDLARKPHKVDSGVIRFSAEKDRTKNTVYLMRKSAE